jgi:hypothetical protein
MAIMRNNPRIRVILLFLAAALTVWGGAAAIPACADTSDWIWFTGGYLYKPRLALTATLVDLGPSDKGVLLVGGGNETNIDPNNIWLKQFNTLRYCDLYRLGQKGFLLRQPSLNQSRALHTATLLPNTGEVLVVGGLSKEANPVELFGFTIWLPGSISTCELFDPKNPDDNWTATGSLSKARLAHTATLLPKTGKLLVAGGIQMKLDMTEFFTKLKIKASVQTLASSELYDPVTKIWSPAANLNHSRALHTATLLPGGKVLVTGGTQLQRNYELDLSKYDPKDWTKWVKITESAIQTLNSSEIYDPDPTMERWDNATSLTQPRVLHTVTLLADKGTNQGKLLAAGGQDGLDNNSTIYRSYELYDPETREWTCDPKKALPYPSSQHTATLLTGKPDKGKVLLVGGSVDPNGAMIYDPKGDFWTVADDFPAYPRAWHTATVLNNDGWVWVAGGVPNVCELYKPASALLKRLAPERLKARLRGD